MISICYYFQESGSATHFKDVYAHLCWKQSCRTGLSWNMGLRALQRGLGQMLKQGEMSGCASMFFTSIPPSGDTEYLYPSSWCAEGKYSDTMGCIFHCRKATACLWEVSVAERLRRRWPLAPDATQLLPAWGWTPGAELTLSRRTGCPAPPCSAGSTSSGKNTSREKVLKAFVVSAELPPYTALRDLHS